jgi:hypothetical protein
MTEKYIYADVEKPFHFWVREGQRWVLRDGGAQPKAPAQRTNPHAGRRHRAQGPDSAAA